MGRWIADTLHERRGGAAGTALVLGLTFKENVPDLRNSRAIDIVGRLHRARPQVDGRRPARRSAEAQREYGVELIALERRALRPRRRRRRPRRLSRDRTIGDLERLVAPGGTLADIKGMWRDRAGLGAIDYWTL